MKEVLKKIISSGRIRQLFQNRLVFFTFFFLLIQPKTRKSLELLQLSIDQKVLARLRKKSKKKIAFFKEHIEEFEEATEDLSDVVWVFWLQGIEAAPELVKKCSAALMKHLPRHKRIIFLDETNYRQYTNLPAYIEEKHEKGQISHTHFSDLIRIDLLARHGGTWVDSTVYLSSEVIHPEFFDSELFLFQELQPNQMGHVRGISNWFMTAKPSQEIILLTRYLLFDYWKTHNSVIDYYIFHSLFELAIEAYGEKWQQVMPYSNAMPHILQFKLFSPFREEDWKQLTQEIEVHKLTYKYPQKAIAGTYLEKILS